jgi:prephenate dehydrogenase
VSVFTKLLQKRNHKLTLYDIDPSKAIKVANRLGCKTSDSIKELAKITDILISCTPLEATPKIIHDTVNIVTNTTLIEIASLKSKTVPVLKKTRKDIQAVSIHPMFGPDIEDIQGNTIITIPVKNHLLEEKKVKSLFPQANHIVLDMDTHDKYMSLILALPYFINMVFLKCLPMEDIELIKKIAGPTFRTQYALADCIISEDPELVKSLIEDNVFVRDNLNNFVYEFKYLRRLLKNRPKDLRDYFLEVKRSIGQTQGIGNSRRIRNSFLRSVTSAQYLKDEHFEKNRKEG